MWKTGLFFLWGWTVSFASSVGMVDFYGLLLLHPEMRHFNFTLFRFYRPMPQSENISFEVWEARRRAEIMAVGLGLMELDSARRTRIASMNAELFALGKNKSGLALAEAEGKIIGHYRQQEDQARAKILEGMQNSLLSVEETQRKFLQIWQDILLSVGTIKQREGLFLVLTRHPLNRQSAQEDRSDHLFAQMSLKDLESGWASWLRNPLGRDGKEVRLRLSDYIIQQKSSIQKQIKTLYPSSLVVVGSKDITLEVLLHIWNRSGVDPKLVSALGKAWQRYTSRQ